jgi:hypothetical protein
MYCGLVIGLCEDGSRICTALIPDGLALAQVALGGSAQDPSEGEGSRRITIRTFLPSFFVNDGFGALFLRTGRPRAPHLQSIPRLGQ